MRILVFLLLASCAGRRPIFEEDEPAGDGGAAPAQDGGQAQQQGGDPPDAGPPKQGCVYPAGPYGIDPGSVVSPQLAWQGYKENQSTVSTLTMSELFDCDGEKGIRAIVVIIAAVWCGPCNQESSALPSVMSSQWGPAGVRVIQLLWQNASRGPATLNDVTQWRTKYNLLSIGSGLDPEFDYAHPNSTIQMPRHVLVDPRTMKIVAVKSGYGGKPDPSVLTLANQNQ